MSRAGTGASVCIGCNVLFRFGFTGTLFRRSSIAKGLGRISTTATVAVADSVGLRSQDPCSFW